MLLLHWIMLGILIAIILAGMIIRCILKRKLRRIEGFKGINNDGPGRGYKIQ